MNRWNLPLAALALLLSVAVAEPPASESAYCRLTEKEGIARIQTRTAVFMKGETRIVLAGAWHLGSPDYYAALQGDLDNSDVVLFEGVDFAATGNRSLQLLKESYALFADVLNLPLQKDRIDYKRKGWRNTDIPPDEFNKRFSKLGCDLLPPDAEEELKAFRALAQNELSRAYVRKAILAMLAKKAEKAGGGVHDTPLLHLDPKHESAVDDLILHRRNEILLKALEAMLVTEHPPQSVGVLYGDAHLPEIESHLVGKLGFKHEESIWRTVVEFPVPQTAQVSKVSDEKINASVKSANELSEQGKHEEAVRVYDELLGRGGSHPIIYYNRARELQALRRFPEADADYSKMIDFPLTMPKAFVIQALANRGGCREQTGKRDEAIRDYETALEMGPPPEIEQVLQKHLARLKKPE